MGNCSSKTSGVSETGTSANSGANRGATAPSSSSAAALPAAALPAGLSQPGTPRAPEQRAPLSNGMAGSAARHTEAGDMLQATVCGAGDMEDGQMREVDVGRYKALLIKNDGRFSAIGHKCTHYGAPLIKGVLSGDRVRCPWHGACFNSLTGDIEDFPGLDSLPCFQVKVEKNRVIVRASEKELQTQKRISSMCRHEASNSTHILIIGGGPAGLVCAETLRQEGFTGRITMLTRDTCPPYDRPKLSKVMNTTAEAISLRPPDFYQDHDITVLTETEAVSVDTRSRLVSVSSGPALAYDKLLIATGSTPRELSCPGAHLEGVYTLRSPDDANRIMALATGANVVVVGSSFIGMEVAASLSEHAHSVSVVGSSDVPFKRTLGTPVGHAIMRLCEQNGVKFYLSNEVSQLRSVERRLRQVVLKSGKELWADVCIVGIGVVPATGFLKHSDIHLDSRGTIPVNKYLQTNVPGVFAAGDVASFPLPLRGGKRVNIAHWQIAHAHGRAVGLAMLNREVEFRTVPFFWTALYGKSLRYTGYGEGFEDVLIQGDLEELRFIAYYTKGDDVVAVASMNWDPVVAHFAEIMNSGGTVTRREVETSDLPWVKGHDLKRRCASPVGGAQSGSALK